MAQCTGRLESHGRQWLCARTAAKKYNNKLCGRCASLHPAKCRSWGRNDGATVVNHSARCFVGVSECDLAPASAAATV